MMLKPNVVHRIVVGLFLFHFSLQVCGQSFTLEDFYAYDSELEFQVDSIFNSLSTREKIAQTIFSSVGELGRPLDQAVELAKNGSVGGFVFLKGSKNSHYNTVNALNKATAQTDSPPLLFGIDAEPTLFNGRVQNSHNIINTNKIKTAKQSDSIAKLISEELSYLGMHINFAPVLDISSRNAAIGSRSYGAEPNKVIALSESFMKRTQECNIVATLKHFPGHGLVSGDTHRSLVYIDGELEEAPNYRPLIDAGVIGVMVGHLAIKNNSTYGTHGNPSTISRRIVTGLLKKEMGYKGIIFTDAMNMSAITNIDKAGLKASMAGIDIILMPPNENKVLRDIMEEMTKNPAYRKDLYQSIKKIIRLKLCLGVFNSN